MSTGARMLAILDAFSETRPAWTVEEICDELSFTRPTGYRYVRELCNAGLILRLTGGMYVVGPRILELDLLIRSRDPLLQVAHPIMRDVVDQSGGDVLLANVYGDQVMNVHREYGPTPASISYDRGRPLPMFRGSTAKAALAFMPRIQLKRIYEKMAKECNRAGLGSTWKEFRAAMAAIRRDGYVIGQGELDSHVIGIAAPIFAEDERILGSLTLIVSKVHYKIMDQTRLIELVLEASRRTTAALSRISKSKTAQENNAR